MYIYIYNKLLLNKLVEENAYNVFILLCLCFNSLYYLFVYLNFICDNNNLYIRLSFHFTYDTDEETRDFEIYLSII